MESIPVVVRNEVAEDRANMEGGFMSLSLLLDAMLEERNQGMPPVPDELAVVESMVLGVEEADGMDDMAEEPMGPLIMASSGLGVG